MKKIIVDFDNTFTEEGRDIDDLIAFLYLYTRSDVIVPFVTTTFGNSIEDVVYECTKTVFDKLNINIPIFRGNNDEAAQNMHSYILANDDVHLLSLGSTSNFKKLLELEDISDKINSITLMGGITEPLYFSGKQMNELNFSVDYESAYSVLTGFDTPNIITGNNCLTSVFTGKTMPEIKNEDHIFLEKTMSRWLDFFKLEYDYDGVVLWDVIAAMYITSPHLFIDHVDNYDVSIEDLVAGHLERSETGVALNLPKLKEPIDYTEIINDIFIAL